MGATLVMLTRNIDVSVGSITGMCAVLLGMLLNAGYSLPVACVATLLLGLLAGFFNGVLVAWLKDPCHCCHPWHVRVVQRHHVAVDWRQMD
ncbi:ABC transporter permease [Escherichia coli]|uniref:Autoinducer 2 import system permease protein LsrC n=1 Tax=Escherichia coli TaxID=562 RepID=A0A377CIT6_ECOLX|nr:ABC transporter permease [Escherichia coli]